MSIGNRLKVNWQVTDKRPTIGDLECGTIVSEVSGCGEMIYIKVRKDCASQGVVAKVSEKVSEEESCVLLNLRYGTLREITKTVCVTPLKVSMNVQPMKDTQLNMALKPLYRREL